jgi:hypothetical protein
MKYAPLNYFVRWSDYHLSYKWVYDLSLSRAFHGKNWGCQVLSGNTVVFILKLSCFCTLCTHLPWLILDTWCRKEDLLPNILILLIIPSNLFWLSQSHQPQFKLLQQGGKIYTKQNSKIPLTDRYHLSGLCLQYPSTFLAILQIVL